VVLPASDGGDVGGDACIDDDVVFSGAGGDWETAKDFKAEGVVDFFRNGAQSMMKVGQREGLLINETERFVECCGSVNRSPSRSRGSILLHTLEVLQCCFDLLDLIGA